MADLSVLLGRPGSADSTLPAADDRRIQPITQQFLCPITGLLPVQPVIAEDGCIYELREIKKLINRSGLPIQSPVTKKPMGGQLKPAIQIRNAIGALVSGGIVESHQAQQWKERTRMVQEVVKTRRRAEGGDPIAMYTLGGWYGRGVKDLELDQSRAYHWYKRASDLNHTGAMAYAGVRLMLGQGVERNTVYGVQLVTIAAERGSDFAVCVLAACFMNGYHGLPKNTKRAARLFRIVVDGVCIFKHLSEQDQNEAAACLRGIEGN